MKLMDGYRCVVTGATSGIGLAICKEFIDQGADVIGIGRHFGKQTEALGEHFIPCYCDITDLEQVEKACGFIREKFDRLDTLVNNAGIGNSKPLEKVSIKEYNDAFNLLLGGPIFFVRGCIELLAKSTNPSIINVASCAALLTGNHYTLYGVPKAGLVMFTKEMVGDLTGIRSNAICPGFIDTPVFDKSGWTPEAKEQIINYCLAMTVPLGRIGRPDEVGKLAMFLASEWGAYINGAVIPIDGGWSTAAHGVKNQERVYRADKENVMMGQAIYANIDNE